jgi:NAD(P)-dependent dehydrogenase (short-subunit alcohol dehydrogenase family)
MICGRHQSEIDEALSDAPGPGQISGFTADLGSMADVLNLFREFDQRFGTIDVLINNAALGAGAAGEMSLEDIDYTLRTNLGGYVACAHEAVTRMRENPDGGFIINIGSMSANVREKGSSVYVATKAGIQGFSEALRKEVSAEGITVTLIEPGATGSDMQPKTESRQRELEGRGEMLMAEDVAEAVLFCLAQPPRSSVVELRLRPLMQEI